MKSGVLLVNLGTPEAPTRQALKHFLAEFLWDRRVVQIPRIVWWLILHLVILRVRPKKSAEAYQKVWSEQGSPLLVFMEKIRGALDRKLNSAVGISVPVQIGMRYGSPNIRNGLEKLKQEGAGNVLVFPLYPQYASATSGSSFDGVAATFKEWLHIPNLTFLTHYYDHPSYIAAMALHIRAFWKEQGKSEFLLFSFHGLPEQSRLDGDPYYDQCCRTADLIAEKLRLGRENWEIVFQSRFGPAKWLQPYCLDTLKHLPEKGICNVDIICPGFSVDCLETLEEIAITNRAVFLSGGGKQFRYIPALNDEPVHIDALLNLIKENLPEVF